MQLLDDLAVGGGDGQGLVAGVGEGVGGGAGERPAAQPGVAAGVGGGDEVDAGPAGRHEQQDVVGPAVGADLPGEDLVVAVVVADRGERTGLGVQGDGRQRLAVVAELADEFGGEVLRLGGAATVAGHQQPTAGGQPVRQLPAPAGQQLLRAPVGQQRGGQGGQVRVEHRRGGGTGRAGGTGGGPGRAGGAGGGTGRAGRAGGGHQATTRVGLRTAATAPYTSASRWAVAAQE